MLMKLTQGVDFTNIFTPSFWTHGAQKRKKTNDLTAFLTLLGSARVKAVHRTLMKLSQGWTTLVLIYSMNCLFFIQDAKRRPTLHSIHSIFRAKR